MSNVTFKPIHWSSARGIDVCLTFKYVACSRLSDSWDSMKIRKGTSPFAFFRALFLNSRFPHYHDYTLELATYYYPAKLICNGP